MDVDDPPVQPSTQIGGEDLHVPGEDDELDVEALDEVTQPRLGGLLRVPGDRNVVEVVAVELGE